MVKNKKAWMRILEATIAVLIISSVLIFVYSGQPRRTDLSDEISALQVKLLSDISLNSTLRNYALNNDETRVSDYIKERIPPYLNFSLTICELGGTCAIPSGIITILDKEIFIEETFISADLTTYSPKKVRLFVWQVN